MRIAVFLTAETEAARRLLAEVRARAGDAVLSVFVNDDDRRPLAAEIAGLDVRRDKPAGGKLAFVRALRRERFDRILVAWHGGERLLPMRIVALFGGARSVHVIDERGREFAVAWYLPWTWAGHALRRAAATKATTVLRVLAFGYRWTVGLVVAAVRLLPTALRSLG